MAKEKTAQGNMFFRELFQVGLYKRSQGRIARQVTFAALAIAVALAAYRLHVAAINWQFAFLGEYNEQVLRYALPLVLAFVGVWIAYRVVNIPSFADFLIAVEAEMNKVSWPTRTELIRSSIVVIVLLFFLAGVLFAYDVFWRQFLSVLQIVQGG
ncbi:MAG: preprotein translocase subunit SecE [Planctomycetota bacterium]|nr:MAG: preprotein translocase subunit SecE [Planctomycetota bacterium]